MSKFFKVFGILTGALLVVGAILIGIGFATGASRQAKIFNFFNLNYGDSELYTLDYTVLDSFDTIDIDMNYGSVEIKEGKDFAIEYNLYSDDVSYSVKNNKLTFRENKKNEWFNFDFSWLGSHKDSSVTIYIPENNSDKINISKLKADMGKVTIDGVTLGEANVIVNMGDTNFKDVTVESLDVDADMGKVTFTGKAANYINVNANMGDINITGYLDCNMDIDCDMGNVEVTSYYSIDSYDYKITTDMGDKDVQNNGGDKLEGKKNVKIDCDMGNATFECRDK